VVLLVALVCACWHMRRGVQGARTAIAHTLRLRSATMAAAGVMETTNAPQIIEHVKKSVNFTPYDTRWVPCSARFVTMGLYPRGTGVLQVYEMKLGELKLVKEVRVCLS